MDDTDLSEECAVAEMLRVGVCFLLHARDLDDGRNVCAVYVNCNDLFYWACADAEPLAYKDVESVFLAWKSDPKHGVDKWCCFHRNLQPQAPIVKRWKEEGVWNEALESLPAPAPS